MKKIRWIPLLLAALLTLSSCGSAVKETLDPDGIIASDDPVNNFSDSAWQICIASGGYTLEIQPSTTAIRVIDESDGWQWNSARNLEDPDAVVNSPFTLTYITSDGKTKTMDAMEMSIARNQYEWEVLDNQLTVRYSVGDYTALLKVPHALSKEHMDALTETIEDEFKREQLRNMYTLTDVDQLDEANRSRRIEEYPGLADQPLYIIRDRVLNYPDQMKRLVVTLKECGYTDEMYEEDLEYCADGSTSLDQENTPFFRIVIRYTLENGALKVSLPYEEIQMNPNCPLVSVQLLKYFGAPQENDEGFFLLPDGSGSLMNFYNGHADLQDYHVSVYGTDFATANAERVYNYDQAYLPVFAIKNGNHGMFAFIEEGDAVADIGACSGNDRLTPFVCAAFRLRESYKAQKSSSKSSDYFMMVQKERYSGDIRMRYTFLRDGDASLAGFAETCRQQIFGSADTLQATAPGLLVDLIGLIDKKEQMLGVSYQKKLVMTAFTDAQEMVSGLREAGVGTMRVKLSGFMNGGLNSGYPADMKVCSQLGGVVGLKDLIGALRGMDISVYPTVDFQYTARNTLFDGYSAGSDAVRLISRGSGVRGSYNFATFCLDNSVGLTVYMNNIASMKKAFTGFFKSYSALENTGVCLANIGHDLFADYSESKGADRQAMLQFLNGQLADTAEDYDVMVRGANAWALDKVSYVYDCPLSSNGCTVTDLSVPFLQMVLSGRIVYSGSFLNLSGDYTAQLLASAATAADLSAVFTAQNAAEFKDSYNSGYYSTDYAVLGPEIARLAVDYQTRLAGFSGVRITDYRALSETVYETVFENGGSVIVNYGYEEFTDADGRQVAARDFSVQRGGNGNA